MPRATTCFTQFQIKPTPTPAAQLQDFNKQHVNRFSKKIDQGLQATLLGSSGWNKRGSMSGQHHDLERPDTPFEDGTFRLILTFDESYPNKPPTVKFLSKMFHPNVYANGELCLDILQNRWSPTYDVAAILTSVQSLLHDPNPNSPANAEAANLYRDNMKDYIKKVRATVEASWIDEGTIPGTGNSSSSTTS
ncbi:hypothetical protein PSHT_05859 [Puccinia striiformis]|uniref:UBC core domain-containing protein n=2 Tax=Puccinia striiformis TaxID=27350 RepID=A0A0L0V3B6_9BASI|nr:hypothetical protein H4Q26_009823 [Puccinia striiformis f. sp. tritici PST-130]KNE93666.1 hypothetical protein PSTG_12949 [Puccinia striiformis f. sp. tritici PST-78]POW18424.1 hypothetical protein PSHT_05859 [Puccinia striiformis]